MIRYRPLGSTPASILFAGSVILSEAKPLGLFFAFRPSGTEVAISSIYSPGNPNGPAARRRKKVLGMLRGH